MRIAPARARRCGRSCCSSCCWAQAAHAHVQQGEAVGFLTGFAHPISGLDHVVAMVAVGLWGAQLGAPAIWLLPVAFPMVMAFGGMLGLIGVPLPGIESASPRRRSCSARAVMFEVRPPLVVAAALVGVLRHLPRPRARHRAAAGPERAALQHGIRDRDRLPARGGHRHRHGPSLALGRTLLRVAGAGVALGGVFFLWRAFA